MESRKQQMVESLLAKPSRKHYQELSKAVPQLDALERVKAFLPDFKKSTERIIQDEKYRDEKAMDIKINEEGQSKGERIEMSIGVGVYDVKGDEEAMKRMENKLP